MEAYLNKDGAGAASTAAQGASKGGKMSGGDLAALIEAFGKVGVSIHDANKRRQMDYRVGQQRLQAELGLADKTREADLDLARMNIIAQTIQKSGGSQMSLSPTAQPNSMGRVDDEKSKNKKTLMTVGVVVLTIGSIAAAYVLFKK